MADTCGRMSGDVLRLLLRSEGRRRLLSEIAREKIISTSELVRRTGLSRQTVNEYVKEFEESGLIAIKKAQKPWIVIASDELEYLLLELPVASERHEKLVYPCSWNEFPECIMKEGVKLSFIWGARGISVAKAHDAVGVPEIVASLLFRAFDKGFSKKDISIMSATDIEASARREVLDADVFLIGSGLVNLLTAKIIEMLQPPVRFEPPVGREIYSEITGTMYNAGDEVRRNAALVALLPNPWSKGRTAVLVAGIFRNGTRAALKALKRHLEGGIIENHPLGNAPIRVVKATPEGDFDGFFE